MNVTKYNKLLKTITSFQEFEDKIKNYGNQEKGNVFELLHCFFLFYRSVPINKIYESRFMIYIFETD